MNFRKVNHMKNINKLIKKFYDEKTEWAEMNGDERFEEFYSRESYDTAKMLYFSEFCQENPADVLDFIYRQGEDDDDKAERLRDLMIRKIKTGCGRYLQGLMEELLCLR